MFCPHCHNKIPDGSNFCPLCYANLVGVRQRETALRTGVMAALCTIHTCRLLEKERA